MAEIVNSNPLNEAYKPHSENHSTFDLSYNFFHTPQFGKYTPVFAKEFIPDDGPIKFRPHFDVRSYTLKAPLMQNISKYVDYFQVPLQAILPFNWEKLYVNPVKGDDVNAELVNTIVTQPFHKLYGLIRSFYQGTNTSLIARYGNISNMDDAQVSAFITDVFRFFITGELFFSHGCLLEHLGVHYSYRFYFLYDEDVRRSFDYVFDLFCSSFLDNIVTNNLVVRVEDADGKEYLHIKTASDLRTALELMRSDTGCGVVTTLIGSAWKDSLDVLFDHYIIPELPAYTEKPLNYGRCVAYQIACAHFYTNDKIDYIFSAELYRQHIYSLIRNYYINQIGEYMSDYDFEYNGQKYQYDYLSGYYFDSIYLGIRTAWSLLFPYFQSIFGFNNSLRFQDYFVGAKSNPRAVGDVNVQVNNNLVSVVDITQNTAKQRFLNAVNRVGMRIDEYIRGLFPGLGKFQSDMHDPQWLASSKDDIYTSEVENTGDAQTRDASSVTAVFRSNSNKYEFTYYGDRPGFVIGIEYFDIRRAYYTTQDRNTMAVDRYDMFIPDMQYVGDQEVSMGELFAGAEDTPFAYTLRDMQFKQFYDEACGGFIENLPGWAFLFNPYRLSGTNEFTAEVPIKPSFIRSLPTELDDFYLSLTGFSPASYFHFIEIVHWDLDDSKRPMVFAPEIL